MNQPVAAGQPLARAFLRVGGASVANHQLALLLALECQRVVALARDLSPGLIALQQTAEARGVQFHVAPDARALARLVTANDELVVLADGLLADSEAARGLLDGGQVVLAQPVEAGLAAGFERIDINTATAGAMRMPGRLAEQLAELPADCDVASALTRISLQAGVPLREIPADLRSGARWRLIRSDSDARAVQDEWLRTAAGSGEAATPGSGLARLLVLSLGHALLQGGKGTLTGFAAALVLLLAALGLGWSGFVASGLLLCALAALFARAAGLLERAEPGGSARLAGRPTTAALVLAIDMAIVALLAWHPFHRPWESLFDRTFAPLALVLALRLAQRMVPASVAAWMEDRFTLAVALAAAAATGIVLPATQGLALAAIVAGLALAPPRARLTGD